jgi:hypothetical protein
MRRRSHDKPVGGYTQTAWNIFRPEIPARSRGLNVFVRRGRFVDSDGADVTDKVYRDLGPREARRMLRNPQKAAKNARGRGR